MYFDAETSHNTVARHLGRTQRKLQALRISFQQLMISVKIFSYRPDEFKLSEAICLPARSSVERM